MLGSTRGILDEQVESIRRLNGSEMWEVAVKDIQGKVQIFYVLEATGEAIGRQEQHHTNTMQIRQDWSER